MSTKEIIDFSCSPSGMPRTSRSSRICQFFDNVNITLWSVTEPDGNAVVWFEMGDIVEYSIF